MKKITRMKAMKEAVVRLPSSRKKPSAAVTAAEPRYVAVIIGLRPTVSKSRPRVSGPRKLEMANTAR